MPEDRGVLREIAWREIFPWLSIARSARLAFSPRLVILAALGLFATSIGWRMIGKIYSGSDELGSSGLGWIDRDSSSPWQTQLANLPPLTFGGFNPIESPIVQTGRWVVAPFTRLFTPDLGVVPFTYTLLCGLWELAMWALFAGAITRIAALALARETRLGLLGGLRFAALKWPQYFLAVLLPLLGVLALGLVVGLGFGLIMRANFGVLVMSFFWPLMLLASLVMAILLLGLLFGWPLMWPTVSVEGSESFDALSRTYSYTFHRPLHYLFYAIVAGAIGLLAAYVVAYFVVWTTTLAFWSASWGTGAAGIQEIQAGVQQVGNLPADTPWSLATGFAVLDFWSGLVALLGAGYLFGYFWTAATAIYYLLRQSTDGIEPDEVFGEHEEEIHGLPPLKSDSSGIPQVADPETGGE